MLSPPGNASFPAVFFIAFEFFLIGKAYMSYEVFWKPFAIPNRQRGFYRVVKPLQEP
jgi:hypothetical protein